MQIEPNDIFAVVVSGSTAFAGLLFVLIGFVISAKSSFLVRSPAGNTSKFDNSIKWIRNILVLNLVIVLFGIGWPLVLHCIMSIQIFSILLMISFIVSALALIALSIYVVNNIGVG